MHLRWGADHPALATRPSDRTVGGGSWDRVFPSHESLLSSSQGLGMPLGAPWDPQGDDTFPLKGLHPDGKLMPSSFVARCGNRKPLKDLKCA
jgi:hypothetical protein